MSQGEYCTRNHWKLFSLELYFATHAHWLGPTLPFLLQISLDPILYFYMMAIHE